ncbi:MAG TPA: YidC/Oxa1 family membrane protein insertase [Candidatus Paceibacterota bacterium]|jgi:YidC/Oxa1 family membrane protein insertase|nr:YidC/Oxa1 family membrane protein insertase [Candidatus Paceibacterota bacterium]
MISSVFHAVVYNPIYNGLVFFVGHLPTHDVGIAVVIVTVIVRAILFPLSRTAIKTQIKMKEIAPEVEEIKKKYKTSEEQGRATLALYKERGVRPFAGFFLTLIQLPILLGLYWVFARGGLPAINEAILYPFVHIPAAVNMEFLGLIDMSKPSILLGILAGIAQFFYTRLSMGPRGQLSATEATLSSDMAKSFDLQARYMLPAMVAVFGVFIASAAPLYWLAGNIFMICQELFTGRRFNWQKKA